MEENKKLDGWATLVKSTENVESLWKTKAPFSYNQLNCNACPFLKPEEIVMSETIHIWRWSVQGRDYLIIIAFITHEPLWDQTGWIESIQLGKKHTYSPPYSWEADPVDSHKDQPD